LILILYSFNSFIISSTTSIKLTSPFYFYKAAKNLENSENFLVKRILQDVNFIEVVEEIINEEIHDIDIKSTTELIT